MKFFKRLLAAALCAAAFTVSPAVSPSAFAAGGSAYSILSDMVFTFKAKQTKAYSETARSLSELKAIDSELGEAWEDIMNYWAYTVTDIEINDGILPDGLPRDETLCIVVLGYQLNPDGSMSGELEGRCRTALACAEKYPLAYVAVTGGGTASANPAATEADRMAAWLEANGVGRERILIENRSQSTMQNAQFTNAVINEKAPEVRYLAIVSSDYHVPQGCLMFTEQFRLSALKNGTVPIPVLANAAYTTGLNKAESISSQADDVWAIADSFEGWSRR